MASLNGVKISYYKAFELDGVEFKRATISYNGRRLGKVTGNKESGYISTFLHDELDTPISEMKNFFILRECKHIGVNYGFNEFITDLIILAEIEIYYKKLKENSAGYERMCPYACIALGTGFYCMESIKAIQDVYYNNVRTNPILTSFRSKVARKLGNPDNYLIYSLGFSKPSNFDITSNDTLSYYFI